jgi:alpha/beta superfamily hydrolase
MTDLRGNIFFDGPVGRIEAIIKEPDGPVTRAAIVCHPHPLYGGTMHNKVVFRIARSFQDAGFSVLRFNFRGTGLSEGEHDNGVGEQDDLRAALNFVANKYPDAAVWVAGFSFGAAVMLRAITCDERVKAIIGAGVPFPKYDFTTVAQCKKPKLFVQGALDEFGSPEELVRLVDTFDEPKELKIIPDADHFFDGHLPELQQTVSSFIAGYADT